MTTTLSLILMLSVSPTVANTGEGEPCGAEAAKLSAVPSDRDAFLDYNRKSKNVPEHVRKAAYAEYQAIGSVREEAQAQLSACLEKVAEAQREQARAEAAAADEQRRLEAERKAAERAQAQAEAEAQKALREKQSQDPAFQRPSYSALLCEAREQRKSALEEIAQEKKYAKVGGVVSLSKLRSLQELVRTADGDIKHYQTKLKALKGAIPCTDAKLKPLLGCKGGEAELCTEDVKAQVAVTRLLATGNF